MTTVLEQIIELNANYNYLGEDLVLLESVLQAVHTENDFPHEFVASSLIRVTDYIQQHTSAINQLSQFLVLPPTAS